MKGFTGEKPSNMNFAVLREEMRGGQQAPTLECLRNLRRRFLRRAI